MTGDAALRREAVPALGYAAAYVGYLFAHREGELAHWLTLVLLPAALVARHRRGAPDGAWRDALASVGLRRGALGRGLWLGAAVGLAICALQLVGSRSRADIVALIESGRALWLFPLSLGLMLATAGFTEEFFFRGVLQTRLERWLRSTWLAIGLTAVVFGLYHVPYAYLHPRWPSYGRWWPAVAQAMGQGVPAGLILGGVYAGAGRNLLAGVLAHALINSLPAMRAFNPG